MLDVLNELLEGLGELLSCCVLDLALNNLVVGVQELGHGLFSPLFVLFEHLFCQLSKLLLQLGFHRGINLLFPAELRLLEDRFGLFADFTHELYELLLFLGQSQLLTLVLKPGNCKFVSLLAFVLANVGPRRLDIGHAAAVDGLAILRCQRDQYLAVNPSALQLLWFHFAKKLFAQHLHLLLKLRSQSFERQLGKVLKLRLFVDWTHCSHTVPFSEEGLQQSPNAVFLLRAVAGSFRFFQSLLKVLFLSDAIASLVLQLQSEVPHDPHKAWENLLELLRILLVPVTLELDVFGKINDQRKLVQRRFIYAPDGVVNETRTEENGQSKNAHIVVLALVEGAQSFGVNHNHV